MVGAPLIPSRSLAGSDRYEPGTVVVLRELLDGRVRSARPLQVVEDGPDGLAAYLVPRSEVAWPRLLDGAQSQTPDQGWRLRREVWQGPGCLFFLPRGEAYAAVLFFDRDDARPLSWKVDFLSPPLRHGCCLDTLDWALDLLVPLDRSDWTVKDTDDLAQLRMLELLGPGGDRLVDAARARAEQAILAAARPFDDPWLRWRPPANAAPLRLPPDCLVVGDRPAPGAAPTGEDAAADHAALRSGSGTRVLDAAGRTWLDVDLAGGRLVHGHAHPVLVAAVGRQLALGLGAEPGHMAVQALDRALRRRLRSPALRWAASGEAALAAAVDAARRVTGRRAVAQWTAVADGPVVRLDQDDLSATLARLQELGDELAAVVVDPLVLAEVQATSEDGGHGDRDVAAALLELLRVWTSDDPHLPQRSVVVVADERRSVGVGPVGGCARFGLTAPLSVVGRGWFGGYGGGALLGRDDLLAALDPADPDTGTGDGRGAVPHPVVAAAGLATLDLLDQPALARIEERAARLRMELGLSGLGPAFRLPPGSEAALRRAGIRARGRWGHLATVSGDEDIDQLLAALRTAPGPPPARRAGTGRLPGDDGRD